MHKKFYLNKNRFGIYYARFPDPVTGEILFTKSTQTKKRDDALLIASEWVKTGIPRSAVNGVAAPAGELQQPPLPMMEMMNTLSLDGIAEMIRMLHERQAAIIEQNEVMMLPSNDGVCALKAERPVLFNKLCKVAEREEGTPCVEIPKTCKKPAYRLTDSCKESSTEPETELQLPQEKRPAKIVVHKKAAKTTESNNTVKVMQYMRNFWTYGTSRWVQEQKALGFEVTERHCCESYKLIDRYYAPYFGEDVTADELDSEALQEFFFYLRIERELAGATVNHVISCGSKVFGYMYQKKLIAENPFEHVQRFKNNTKERSIHTETEIVKLLHTEWRNEASYLAFYLGTFCGLRASEISGLRRCDLDVPGELLHIRHSWNDKDKLKSTKNTDCRSVPIDAGTLQRIVYLADQNPQAGEMSYVFWSPTEPSQPYWPSYFRDGLYEAMESIGISKAQREERNIVFHSLRHFCATILTKRGDLDTVRQILGHRTEAMTKHYSNHESEEKQRAMRDALEKSREYIFNFKAG